VQRLVAVLGARGVTRGALLSDAPLDAAGLADGERAALAAAGWAPGFGLRSLLNFNGESRSLPSRAAECCQVGSWCNTL
jgi:hypothetical protein